MNTNRERQQSSWEYLFIIATAAGLLGTGLYRILFWMLRITLLRFLQIKTR